MGLDNQEEVMQKEIQSLKRKTLYLGMATIVFAINLIFSMAYQARYYAAILDYYHSTWEQNQELLHYLEEFGSDLEERNGYLREILSAKN